MAPKKSSSLSQNKQIPQAKFAVDSLTREERLNKIIQTQSKLAEANFDLQSFLNLAVEQMLLLTHATGIALELVEKDEMVYRAVTGSVASYLGLRLPRKNSISGLCVKTHEVLESKDTEVDPRVNLEACRKVGARSMVVTPLFHEGKAVGVLKILSNQVNAFNEDDLLTLKLMANLIGSALAHQLFYESMNTLLTTRTNSLSKLKKNEHHLKRLANYDHLTGLANRHCFNERLKLVIQRAKRTQKHFALLYIDVDNFKQINDKLGHDVGDSLLSTFSKRLKRCIRTTDVAARLGGDEFIVILEEVNTIENVIKVTDKILETTTKRFTLGNKALKTSVSIGIAFCDDMDVNAKELLKHADLALYQAKISGKNNYKIYGERA